MLNAIAEPSGRPRLPVSRSTVSRAPGSDSTRFVMVPSSADETWTGSSPFLRALARKMSANELATTTRNPQSHQRPRRVLARGAAAEVVPCDQDPAAGRPGSVEGKVRQRRPVLRVAPVGEEVIPEAGPVDRLEEPGRNDLVGVDVVARQQDRGRDDPAERLVDARAAHPSALGSARRPVTAEATAVRGEARKVRPPLPCLPSKFRLLVLTAYWPGLS